jgi:hypothetical protein
MRDQALTKTTGALLVAVRNHVDQLVDGNHVDAGQLRLTISARQEQARELVAAGLSQREAAKELGVGKETIRRDLGLSKVAHNGPKVAHNEPIGHPLDGCGTDYDVDEEMQWRNNLGSMAAYSMSLLSHWEKRFSNWRDIKVTIEDIELAEGAAQSWAHIATTLKGNMK